MARSTANQLEGLTDGFRHSTVEVSVPATNDVETELRRLARQRLDPTTDRVAASDAPRVSRSFRHRRRPLVGAFDSPPGFVFASPGTSRKR